VYRDPYEGYQAPTGEYAAVRPYVQMADDVSRRDAVTADPPTDRALVAELPQRVPSEPDVPDVPPDVGSLAGDFMPAETPELARIATYLRHDEDDDTQIEAARPDGFDIPAVLNAVRQVAGVREAMLRPNPDGVHTLRLELYEDADPALVSREVARLLKERMGLAAEPNIPTPEPVRPSADATAPSRVSPPSPGASAPGAHTREARRRRPQTAQRPPQAYQPPAFHGSGPIRTAPVRTTPAEESAPPGAVPRSRVPVDPEVRVRTALPLYLDQATSGGTPAAAARPVPGGRLAPRIVLDQVEITTHGIDALVEVRLAAGGRPEFGVASGPAVDGYVLRLCAVAAAAAIDQLLDQGHGPTGRCYIEQASIVTLGSVDVAVVVLLLATDGWVEQLTGSAIVDGDQRQAVVRATLAAVNRRIEALLP
jgi:hypothetical protein